MIVIGASKGGLDPLRTVTGGLPVDLPAAVLVVRHTLPNATPVLASVLRCGCRLPVLAVADGLVVEPGHVYVAQPGWHATMVRDDDAVRFAPRAVEPGERETPSIDLAIVSAAQQFGGDCIAVILSGYLDDGTEGARHLARHDGTTLVQSPESAEVGSMPLNVLRRDSPEFALEQHDIARVLVELTGEVEPAWLDDPERRAGTTRRVTD